LNFQANQIKALAAAREVNVRTNRRLTRSIARASVMALRATGHRRYFIDLGQAFDYAENLVVIEKFGEPK